MKRRSLKTWTFEAAETYGVSPRRIYDWQRRGYFSARNFRHINARVVQVLGEPQLLRTPTVGPQVRYDFRSVDWSQIDRVIAERLGCCRSLVTRRRHER